MLNFPLVSLVGPRAMISYKPRQARKGATVVADSCAVVWLARDASEYSRCKAKQTQRQMEVAP